MPSKRQCFSQHRSKRTSASCAVRSNERRGRSLKSNQERHNVRDWFEARGDDTTFRGWLDALGHQWVGNGTYRGGTDEFRSSRGSTRRCERKSGAWFGGTRPP